MASFVWCLFNGTLSAAMVSDNEGGTGRIIIVETGVVFLEVHRGSEEKHEPRGSRVWGRILTPYARQLLRVVVLVT